VIRRWVRAEGKASLIRGKEGIRDVGETGPQWRSFPPSLPSLLSPDKIIEDCVSQICELFSEKLGPFTYTGSCLKCHK
jgi:hypothetical protein